MNRCISVLAQTSAFPECEPEDSDDRDWSTFKYFVPPPLIQSLDPPPGHVSTLSGWVLPYPAGYDFPWPFGSRLSLLGRPIPLGHGSNLTVDRLL
jgi:hypothetical protein